MKKWYGKLFHFEKFIGKNISLILLYVISALIGLVAYNNGVIEAGPGNEISFIGENLVDIILIAFAFINSCLVQLTPLIVIVWAVIEYNKIFSNNEVRRSIIPKSNTNKLRNISFIVFIAILIYFITTFLISYLIGSKNSINGIIGELCFRIGIILSVGLSVIVVDMWSRGNHIDYGARKTWNGITVVVSFTILNILFAIFASSNITIFWMLLTVVISVKLIYIFRNIENIKID